MRAGRRGIVVALVIVLVAGGLWAAVPAVARFVLERRIAAETGLAVAIGSVRPTFSPLGFVLGDVALATEEGASPLVTAARVDLFQGRSLRRLAGVTLFARDRTADSARPTGDAAERSWRLDDLELEAPTVELQTTTLTLPDVRLERLDLRVRPSTGELGASGRLALAGGTVHGWVRLRPGSPSRFDADLALANLDVAALPQLASRSGLLAGSVDGRLRYRRVGAESERVRGRLVARGLESASDLAWRVRFDAAELRGMDVDLEARSFTGRRVAVLGGTIAPAQGPPSRQDQNAAVASPDDDGWTVAITALEARSLLLQPGDELPDVRIDSLSARGFGSADGTFALDAFPASGGRVRASGELDVRKPSFRGDLHVEEVALGPWLAPFEDRVRLSQGLVGGRFELWGPPGIRGRGTLEVDDAIVKLPPSDGTVHADAGEGDGADVEHARLDRLRAELRGFTVMPPRLWLTSAEIEGPSLTIVRGPDGFEPLDSLGRFGESSAPPAADVADTESVAQRAWRRIAEALGDAPPLDLPSIEVTARLREGRLRFVDEQTSPPFTNEIAGLEGSLAAWGGPPWGAVRAELSGRIGEAPVDARASIDGPRFAFTADVAELPLAPWSSYLSPGIGYTAASGRMKASLELEWENGIRGLARLALDEARLERGAGSDRLENVFGMPFERALALMTDSRGRSEIVLRVEGDSSRPGLGIVEALPAALREALPEAVTVPLFEGAETVDADEGHVRLAPLAFATGRAEIATEHAAALERLAVVLRWDPALVVDVAGSSDAEDAKTVAAREKSTESANLGGERAAAVRARLVDDLGIATDRVRVLPPQSGAPSVRLELRPGEPTP
jgi:hypothetical protein